MGHKVSPNLNLGDITNNTDVFLDNFHIQLSNPVAGGQSNYAVSFEMSYDTYTKLNNGGISFVFPDNFDISQIYVSNLSTDSKNFNLQLQNYHIFDQIITLMLKSFQTDEENAKQPLLTKNTSNSDIVKIELLIGNVKNSSLARDYQLTAVGVKQNNIIISGPSFSNFFFIKPNALASIKVIPSADTTVQAGTSLDFSAEGYDEFGNKIEGLNFVWSLENCTNCIGIFSDSTLYVTHTGTGRAIAKSSGISGESGLITVIPGELYRMMLSISDSQFVGYVFHPTDAIILYDEFDNLITDYDLSLHPITLNIGEGILEPNIIDDNSFLIGGVIRLQTTGIHYIGPSTTTEVYATSEGVTSNTKFISFNRYDILDAVNLNGETINRVFAGHQTNVKIPIINRGNIVSGEQLMLTYSYRSQAPQKTSISLTPPPLNEIDTVDLSLPALDNYPAEDTLVLMLQSSFMYGGEEFLTVDTEISPISVISPAIFNVAEGSFKPDTILAKKPFKISFDISSDNFNQPIDSVNLTVQLTDTPGGDAFTALYQGTPSYTSYENGIISYHDLIGNLNSYPQNKPNGWYYVKLDYNLYSSGEKFTLENSMPDSIFVIFNVALSYIEGSFAPLDIYTGSDITFSFNLNYSGDLKIKFLSNSSIFTLSGDNYISSTNLLLQGDSLINGVNVIKSSPIFLSDKQKGKTLNPQAKIKYLIAGIPDTLILIPDFSNLTISVSSMPTVQIISLDVIAPNAPMVNTGQGIKLSCRIANLSETSIDSLKLKLTSDGSSVFEPINVVRNIAPHDTTEIFYDITTSSEPTYAEIFYIHIIPDHIIRVPSIDDIALINIETPPLLKTDYKIFGTENDLIDYSTPFNFNIEIVNSGAGHVSDGAYILVADGLDFNGPDTLTGIIKANKHINFSFVSPDYDTTLNFIFHLVDLPIDLNTGLPAQIVDTTFKISLKVISSQAELYIQSSTSETNLVLPGRKKGLFSLDLTNSGISSFTSLSLDKIELHVKDKAGNPINVRGLINIGNTGFYENGKKVSLTTGSMDKFVFTFDDFIIDPQQTRTITLYVDFKMTNEKAVVFEIENNGVTSHFISGPNIGQSPVINSNSQGTTLLTETFSLIGLSLKNSFVIETNPFNPDEAPVRFSYELPKAQKMEFRIFTLTGEEVLARDYFANTPGGMAGENMIEWDGRNNDGDLVFNGVYIASIKNVKTGEYARIKVAVVR